MDGDGDGEDPPSDHKLCGYLRAVLTINPSRDHTQSPPPLNTHCHLSSTAPHFITKNGTVLSPIDEIPETENDNNSSSKNKNKRWNRIGMVQGSFSVVRMLHALVSRNCLTIVARVVGIEARGSFDEEVRVVVLVDVYLPSDLWSGWQFPRSGSTAAALFRHLSCDWEVRSSILQCSKHDHGDYCSIWNVSDCHVLGCRQQCSIPDPSKKKLFELHEIFKSLPSVVKKGESDSSRVNPADASKGCGIGVLPDDVVINILINLGPIDLLKISSTCRHLRFLAASIMPCMKLKLYPHQQAAVEWMLQRERDPEVLRHPLYKDFLSEDGLAFYINTVSGEIVTGVAPTIKDFRGGMFCDEPGLGKTITALSLILKTQGTLADPPDGLQVTWCIHNADQRRGYYELSPNSVISGGVLSRNGDMRPKGRRGQLSLDELTPKQNMDCFMVERVCSMDPSEQKSPGAACSTPVTSAMRCTRGNSLVKRNLQNEYEKRSVRKKSIKSTTKRKQDSDDPRRSSPAMPPVSTSSSNSKRRKKYTADKYEEHETWIQCDSCRKWRKLAEGRVADSTTAWFCTMNTDPSHQSCCVPEESWDQDESITYLPGFHTKGTPGGKEENVSFFINVLREHYSLINSDTKKALTWLAKLSPHKLLEMETVGLMHISLKTGIVDARTPPKFHKIFQAFNLIKKIEKGTTRWYYPVNLVNLEFDLDALRIALCKPLDSFRIYLSKATLVVVPSNLVDHWKTQIERHVRPGQLNVYVWTDHKRPPAHSLAWDYDVVITTFSRLSAEWSPRKRSELMQVHWLRVMLDEGHTLGSSVSLTNKLQMVVSLSATNRWLLTGTPTPNTPNSQLSHFHSLLKFLQEEAYGQNQKSWEASILRPFEAELEEGRLRLLDLLHRCMISARKTDLHTIPPCIKKVTLLNFTEEHARTYNELVETVRRNILLADWNDPSHVESLLNPKQWKFRSATIKNVRLSCCVAGHIRVTDAGEDIQETMDELVEKGLEPHLEEYALIRYKLLNGGICMRCKEWCRLPIITPCRHFLCVACVALDSEKCTFPGCGYLYEMQSPETLARPENPNPKWPVPQDLIELQPSYKQDDWNPDWQSTSSSKVTYLVSKLKELQEANKKTNLSFKEKYLNDHGKHISSWSCEIDPTMPKTCCGPRNELCKIAPEKVIIFSQFLEHIHVIEQQLTVANIQFAGMYSPMHSSNKMKALVTFQHDPNCMALVMDGSAALGLDLSFVSRVFLMEPIWDKSTEEQVISRAHRMGATRPIHVETLAMSGTIEEQMLRFLMDAGESRKLLKTEFGEHDSEGPRAYRTLHDFAESSYLSNLSFMRTHSMT